MPEQLGLDDGQYLIKSPIGQELLDQAVERSTLPDNPDMEQVERFVEYVNRKAIVPAGEGRWELTWK